MPDWSIKIIPTSKRATNEPAAFVPDLIGATPGTPLEAHVEDI